MVLPAVTLIFLLAIKSKLAFVPAVLVMLSFTTRLLPETKIKSPFGLPIAPMLIALATVSTPDGEV